MIRGFAIVGVAASLGLAGDRRDKTPEPPPGSASAASSARPSSASSQGPAGSVGATPSTTATRRAQPSDDVKARPTARLTDGDGPWVVDEAVDVGPSGPAAAHESGVVLIDRHDTLLLARRTPMPERAAPGKTGVATIERPREDFARYGRGPAIVGGDAYWVSQGRLVKRRLDGSGDLSILATDARKGTRVVAVERTGAAPLVAYITAPDSEGTARAKLWTGKGEGLTLTAEGAGSSSVALVAQNTGALVVTLDGRSGMTPLHVRRLHARGQGFALGADVVAWVGASAQGGTEVFAGAAADGDAWAFVAIEQDIRHFGLAAIHLGQGSRHDAPASYTTYENGLNTAPVATANVCGRLVVAFVVPGAAPSSEQELLLAPVGPDGVEAGVVVARRRVFADCSLAAVRAGALLAYTADQRTFAVSLRCR